MENSNLMRLCANDLCLFYGLPGVAMLVQALFPTLAVSADFPDDTLVKSVTYIASSLLLGLLYFIFQSQLQELAPYMPLPSKLVNTMRKRKEDDALYNEDNGIYNYNNECASASEQGVLPEPADAQEKTEPEAESTLAEQPYTDACEQRKAEADIQLKQYRETLRKAISDYIYHAISPFAKEAEVAAVHGEVMAWIENSQHAPKPVKLSGREDARGIKTDCLTSIDLRHFIWNIAERLDDNKNYTGLNRAAFAKDLFPNEFATTEIGSIRKFTVSPNSGFIHLDRPKPGSFEFRQ